MVPPGACRRGAVQRLHALHLGGVEQVLGSQPLAVETDVAPIGRGHIHHELVVCIDQAHAQAAVAGPLYPPGRCGNVHVFVFFAGAGMLLRFVGVRRQHARQPDLAALAHQVLGVANFTRHTIGRQCGDGMLDLQGQGRYGLLGLGGCSQPKGQQRCRKYAFHG